MVDGIEDPETGLCRVPGHDDHFRPSPAPGAIEPQDGLHQFEAGTRREQAVLVVELVLPVGLQALLAKNAIFLSEIEKGPG